MTKPRGRDEQRSSRSPISTPGLMQSVQGCGGQLQVGSNPPGRCQDCDGPVYGTRDNGTPWDYCRGCAQRRGLLRDVIGMTGKRRYETRGMFRTKSSAKRHRQKERQQDLGIPQSAKDVTYLTARREGSTCHTCGKPIEKGSRIAISRHRYWHPECLLEMMP